MVDMRELGYTGLERNGNQVAEEFLRELRFDRGRRIYREMSEMDPIVGATLFAIQMLMAQVETSVEPAEEENPDDTTAAEFVDECLGDMSSSWAETLGDILSMMTYGWAYLEIVYKRRGGESRDPKRNSTYTDGRIGWRKWAIRGQNTLDEWQFDEEGGVQGMWQRDGAARVFVPIEKSLLFRTVSHKNNPEGRSALRSAYRPWWFKRNIENVEGIGIERDLAGLPVAYVPPDILSPAADADERAVLDAIKDIVVNIRRDEQEGIIFPLMYDEAGNQLYKLELMTSGGARQFDTDTVINRYANQIAMTLMADFILMGHEGVGSYALGADKSTLFRTALTTWLDRIAAVINQYAIPRLLRLNGMRGRCEFKFGAVGTIDLSALGTFIQQLAGAGMTFFPDVDLENHLRTETNLPPLPDDEVQRREEQRQTDVTPQMQAMMAAAQRILSRGE